LVDKTNCIHEDAIQRWEEVKSTAYPWTIPQAADDVTVVAGQSVMITNSTARVGTLVVEGTLFVNPEAIGHVKIYARRIFVGKTGNFHHNASANPNLKLQIILYSDETTPLT
jgi:hypothetical protein